MASRNVDFSDYHKIAPPYDEPPSQRGCFFYGCIIAVVLSLLLLIAVGVIFFGVYRFLGRMVEEYTATAPQSLPVVEMPAEKRASLKERVESFQKALKEGRATEPLVLSSEDLNALIEENSSWKGKIHVEMVEDRMKGQVSIPLSELPSFGLTRGRYLNGQAEFNVWLKDGVPFVTISSLEANGKRASEEFLAGIRGQNLLKDMQVSPETAAELRKLESVEVRDGTLIFKPREPAKVAEGGPSGSSPRDGNVDEKAERRTPGHGPVPANGPRAIPEDLPDDVLAPPGSRPAVPFEATRKP